MAFVKPQSAGTGVNGLRFLPWHRSQDRCVTKKIFYSACWIVPPQQELTNRTDLVIIIVQDFTI
jgi:hypothetical protein